MLSEAERPENARRGSERTYSLSSSNTVLVDQAICNNTSSVAKLCNAWVYLHARPNAPYTPASRSS